jgi:ABC-type transport system involved in cytochrome bd biosynthesis fused ATPase/permease subunit
VDGITATGGGGAVPSVVVVVVVAARDRFLGSDGPVSSSFSLALLVDILRFLFWICALDVLLLLLLLLLLLSLVLAEKERKEESVCTKEQIDRPTLLLLLRAKFF